MNKFIPHDYQKTGISFIKEHEGAAVVADMGLGKTAMCLHAARDLFLNLEIKGILVVAPLRVAVLTWPMEIENWEDTAWMSYSIVQGPKRLEALNTPADIYLINYENLLWLKDILAKIKPKDWPFDMIIWDELTRMKSPKAKRFKLFKKYVKFFSRRVGLTGTPTPQGYIDLWAQYYMLDSGFRLGTSFTRFKQRFFYAEDYQQYKWVLHDWAADKINKRIEDITIRIAEEGNLDLPPCTIEDIELKIPSHARDVYDELEAEMFTTLHDGNDVEALSAASLTNKCHQVCGGALYTDSKKNEWTPLHDTKIKALKSLVKSLDEPVLVAYSFRHEAQRIMKAFPDAVQLKSGLSKEKERDILDRWNRREIPMLVCHPASAGHGLNLQKGSRYAIWYSLSWSLEYYLQLNKRVHRQGQTRPVTIYRMIMQASTDCVVASCLERKECTQADFLQAIEVYNKNRNLF